ncbi:condensin subunit [Lasius niger]|uniref:Condensin subunit n=1 Tax=Lasius niger TaxID=67767 RepID=A0A0J7KEU5_LASNI|nr:condensin subunit [Lasius niger]
MSALRHDYIVFHPDETPYIIMIELHMKEYIQFNELIPDTYSAKDKTTAFHLLLELHAQRKIVLTQKDCHDTLWIWKYNIYD